jgi:hypothetical protein
MTRTFYMINQCQLSLNARQNYLPPRLMFENQREIFWICQRLIGSDQNMEFGICITWPWLWMVELELSDNFPSLFFAIERDNSQFRCPSFKFPYPIGNGGVWNDNKRRESIPTRSNITEKGCNLYRFALQIMDIIQRECTDRIDGSLPIPFRPRVYNAGDSTSYYKAS